MYTDMIRPILFRLSSDEVHEKTVHLAALASRSEWLCNRIEQVARSVTHASTKGIEESISPYENGIYSIHSPLAQTIQGLHFRNPIGLAAGFDKNGMLPSLMFALGFGFEEIGSITALPSPGNPLPRSFRLTADFSLINRMGLNNEGAEVICKRLTHKQKLPGFPLGINIAKTHNPGILGDEGVRDYQISYRFAEEIADYITINVSCPNTAEGKTFEDPEALLSLLNALPIRSSLPVWIKFSPDLDRSQLRELLSVTDQFPITGYVATNTSVAREGLLTDSDILQQIGKGGLSGRAIRKKSTQIIEWIRQERPQKPIIGVGGIESLDDILEKMKAGASLVQFYTALVYHGPFIAAKLNGELLNYMLENGFNSIQEIQNS